jgi:hypothetical protein
MTKGFCPSLDDLWGSGHIFTFVAAIAACIAAYPIVKEWLVK